MKHLLTAALACVILFVTACKKEKTADPKKIGGDYKLYEWEANGQIQALPNTDGDHGKIVVTLTTDSTVTVKFYLYDKDEKPEINGDTFTAKVVKDQDGDIILVKSNNDALAWIWEGYDMDFLGYKSAGYRFSAKK